MYGQGLIIIYCRQKFQFQMQGNAVYCNIYYYFFFFFCELQLQAASLLFVDNPVGTGYSYVDKDSAYTHDVEEIADDMLVLLKTFFGGKGEPFQVNKTFMVK